MVVVQTETPLLHLSAVSICFYINELIVELSILHAAWIITTEGSVMRFLKQSLQPSAGVTHVSSRCYQP